ncbi:sulfite exporter TauE/SafE family protein [Gandjariella thermophila]|uniref:Probable membrane transporter protein n=1 Tax=Gandjariella thermophila TaxID=1931992 RepID=A0A4D4J992_9PSEU|nr:sulfite exporter TauE/SafE family protein [Gandjariella thermophila]GDY31238.1 UPF0721 transmembrane protein [Gandjariella thermophila]
MTGLEAAGVVLAGVFAGTINTVVGSGTLVTFPALLAVGYPPVTANVSNSLGLVPGSLAGAIGYRRELAGQRRRLWQLGSASLLGAILGAVLLLTLPPEAFQAIVPVLIGIALVLVIIQPWLARRLAHRRLQPHAHASVGLWLGVFCTGVYGGYFGAAQGVLLLGLMGVLVNESLQRINAVKNVLAMLVNLVAGIVFIFIAHVAWLAVLLVAVGSLIGGWLGARIGRRLPPVVFRAIIVAVGVAAIVKLVAS